MLITAHQGLHLDQGPSSRCATTINRHHLTNRDISCCWLLIGDDSVQSPWILSRVVSNILYTTLHYHDHRGRHHPWHIVAGVLPHISPTFTKETFVRAPGKVSLHPPQGVEESGGQLLYLLYLPWHWDDHCFQRRCSCNFHLAHQQCSSLLCLILVPKGVWD